MLENMNIYNDYCEILASCIKYFSRKIFLKNAQLSHVQAFLLHVEL